MPVELGDPVLGATGCPNTEVSPLKTVWDQLKPRELHQSSPAVSPQQLGNSLTALPARIQSIVPRSQVENMLAAVFLCLREESGHGTVGDDARGDSVAEVLDHLLLFSTHEDLVAVLLLVMA